MCQLSIVGTRGVHGCGLCITLDTHTKCFCVVTLCLVDCGVLRVPYDIHLLYCLGESCFQTWLVARWYSVGEHCLRQSCKEGWWDMGIMRPSLHQGMSSCTWILGWQCVNLYVMNPLHFVHVSCEFCRCFFSVVNGKLFTCMFNIVCCQIAWTCTRSFTMCTVKQLMKKLLVEIYVDYWTFLFYSFFLFWPVFLCILLYRSPCLVRWSS